MMLRTIAVVSLSVLVVTLSFANDQSAAKDSQGGASVQSSDSLLTLTVSELAKYNGQNGAKAYVAVDGVVYDVTNVKAWKNGKHHGASAGNDVTDKIKRSPHGKRVLKKLTVVGKLVPDKS